MHCKALRALQKEKKFMTYIGKYQWPTEMKAIPNNTLRSTILDDEIIKNAGNGDIAMTPSLKLLRRHYPKLAEEIEQLQKNAQNVDCTVSRQSGRAG